MASLFIFQRKPHLYTKALIQKERHDRYQSKYFEIIQSEVHSLYLSKPWMPQSFPRGWALSRINLHNVVKEINVLLSDVSRNSR